MLRYTIEHGQRATVGEEFAFLELYCRLQKLRFEERFSYEFELEPAAADLPIPKLLVQPLLENAVIHGIEPSTRPCSRQGVRRGSSGAALGLEVEDDGVGCDPAAHQRAATHRHRQREGAPRPAVLVGLPRARRAPLARASGARITIPSPSWSDWRELMRLLVADDERPARFVLRSLLEELGFDAGSIEEVAGGPRARRGGARRRGRTAPSSTSACRAWTASRPSRRPRRAARSRAG